MTLKQMTKDERLNLWKPKISRKPAQNFMKCLPPFLSPQSCFALFVGRANTFIKCLRTKLSLDFAYLRA